MTLDEYQAEARRTAPRTHDAYPTSVQLALETLADLGSSIAASNLRRGHDVIIWALGLAGEAGEVCDLLKKVHGHATPYDPVKLKKELGDTLWYLSNIADAHGFTLEDVAQTNVAKLRARHPNGFTVATANAKADEKAGGQ